MQFPRPDWLGVWASKSKHNDFHMCAWIKTLWLLHHLVNYLKWSVTRQTNSHLLWCYEYCIPKPLLTMAKAAICRSCVDKASSLSQPCNNLCLAASLLDSILECVGRGVMARSVCLMWIIIYDYIHEKRLESKAPVKHTNRTGLMKLRPTCSLQVSVSAF